MVFINVFETVVLEKRTASQTPEVSPEAAKEYTACPQPAEAASTTFQPALTRFQPALTRY
jgi:hypothetical protein